MYPTNCSGGRSLRRSRLGVNMPAVLLGGYAAKRCPVRVHNDFCPDVPTLAWLPSPEDQTRLDAGVAFERSVFDLLKELHPDCLWVDGDLSKLEAIRTTVRRYGFANPPHNRRMAA